MAISIALAQRRLDRAHGGNAYTILDMKHWPGVALLRCEHCKSLFVKSPKAVTYPRCHCPNCNLGFYARCRGLKIDHYKETEN